MKIFVWCHTYYSCVAFWKCACVVWVRGWKWHLSPCLYQLTSDVSLNSSGDLIGRRQRAVGQWEAAWYSSLAVEGRQPGKQQRASIPTRHPGRNQPEQPSELFVVSLLFADSAWAECSIIHWVRRVKEGIGWSIGHWFSFGLLLSFICLSGLRVSFRPQSCSCIEVIFSFKWSAAFSSQILWWLEAVLLFISHISGKPGTRKNCTECAEHHVDLKKHNEDVTMMIFAGMQDWGFINNVLRMYTSASVTLRVCLSTVASSKHCLQFCAMKCDIIDVLLLALNITAVDCSVTLWLAMTVVQCTMHTREMQKYSERVCFILHCGIFFWR